MHHENYYNILKSFLLHIKSKLYFLKMCFVYSVRLCGRIFFEKIPEILIIRKKNYIITVGNNSIGDYYVGFNKKKAGRIKQPAV